MIQLDFWALALAVVVYRYLARKNRRPYAPGPPGYPIVGNLFDIPSKRVYLKYTTWAKEYKSEILNLNILGTNIVILNSLRVINELFDKKSAIYSSRPQFTMIGELMGWNFLFSTMPYNEDWRRRRRLLQRFFPASRASEFQPQQRTYVRRLLPQLIDPAQDFAQALRHFTSGIAITLAYGISTKPVNDPYINLSERAIALLNQASAPGSGKYLVDTIPWLKYVPDWFPGAQFQKDAKEWRKATLEFREAPFRATKQDIENGVVTSSYTATCLENISATTEQERFLREGEIQDTAAIFFAGGTDTTMSVLVTFMLTMTRYPSAQTKAQEELDRVVGRDRLPDFSDSPNLHYLNALIREVLRWHPAGPVGIPHSTTEDDVYDGYFIPKGSVVLPNVWAILQDPETYPNPRHFCPQRFLTPSGTLDLNIKNPADVVFGFGRRACPGAHMALSTLFIAAACILHTMEISWPSSAKGRVEDVEFTDTLFPIAEPFPCSIKSRSKDAEDLIKNEARTDY